MVSGPANGNEPWILAEVGVDSSECTSGARKATSKGIRGVEALAGVVVNGCTSRDGAIDRGCIRSSSAAKRIIRCRDGGQRGGLVQITSIANVVSVVVEQEVHADVAQIIHGKHRAVPELPLDANIHLPRTWCAVIGSDQVVAGGVGSVGQGVTNVASVGLRTGGLRRLLEQRLQSGKIRECIPDRLTADLCGEVMTVDRCYGRSVRQRQRTTRTREAQCQEEAFLQTNRTVKQHVVPDRVLVIETAAQTNHGLPALRRAPCDSHLWPKVQIGLINSVAYTCSKLIHHPNPKQI